MQRGKLCGCYFRSTKTGFELRVDRRKDGINFICDGLWFQSSLRAATEWLNNCNERQLFSSSWIVKKTSIYGNFTRNLSLFGLYSSKADYIISVLTVLSCPISNLSSISKVFKRVDLFISAWHIFLTVLIFYRIENLVSEAINQQSMIFSINIKSW